MDSRHADIERIVREVLARLSKANTPRAEIGHACGDANSSARAGATGRNGAVATSMASQRRSTAGSAPVLRLDARLVTLADVMDQLEGLETLEVPARAVVTPAVRDALRERGISLAWRVPGSEPRRDVTLCIAAAETAHTTASVRGALAAQEVRYSDVPPGALADVVEHLAGRIMRDGVLALLLTERTAAAVCLANRHRCMRAAAAASVDEVREASRQIDPNVLVVDPRGKSSHLLRRLVAVFVERVASGSDQG